MLIAVTRLIIDLDTIGSTNDLNTVIASKIVRVQKVRNVFFIPNKKDVISSSCIEDVPAAGTMEEIITATANEDIIPTRTGVEVDIMHGVDKAAAIKDNSVTIIGDGAV